jgi:hypothetical protein
MPAFLASHATEWNIPSGSRVNFKAIVAILDRENGWAALHEHCVSESSKSKKKFNLTPENIKKRLSNGVLKRPKDSSHHHESMACLDWEPLYVSSMKLYYGQG